MRYAEWFEQLSEDMSDEATKDLKELCLGEKACEILGTTITWTQSPEDPTVVEPFLSLHCGNLEGCGLECYGNETMSKVAYNAVAKVANNNPKVVETHYQIN